MNTKYISFLFILLPVFLFSNVSKATESLQLIKEYALPVSLLSFISVNPYEGQTMGKFIWVVDRSGVRLVQVDLDLLKENFYLPVPGLFGEGICWEDRLNVWLSDSEQKQINLISAPGGKKIRSFASPGNGPAGLVKFAGYLWNLDFSTNKLYKISPLDGKVLNSVDIPGYAEGMTATSTALFFIAENQLHQFDPNSNTISNSWPLPFSDAMGLAWDGNYFYISRHNLNKIYVFELR